MQNGVVKALVMIDFYIHCLGIVTSLSFKVRHVITIQMSLLTASSLGWRCLTKRSQKWQQRKLLLAP